MDLWTKARERLEIECSTGHGRPTKFMYTGFEMVHSEGVPGFQTCEHGRFIGWTNAILSVKVVR